MYTLYYTVKCQTHCKIAQSTLTHKNKNSFDISQTAAGSYRLTSCSSTTSSQRCFHQVLQRLLPAGAAVSVFGSLASTWLSAVVHGEACVAWLPYMPTCLQPSKLENLSADDNTKSATLNPKGASCHLVDSLIIQIGGHRPRGRSWVSGWAEVIPESIEFFSAIKRNYWYMQNHSWISLTPCWVREVGHGVHPVGFHSYKIVEWLKLIIGDESQNKNCLWRGWH